MILRARKLFTLDRHKNSMNKVIQLCLRTLLFCGINSPADNCLVVLSAVFFNRVTHAVFHFYSLDTPSLEYTGPVCITFFYSMYGIDMGSLLVFTSFRGEDNPVFMRSGDRGDTWHEAAVSTTISYEERVG